MDLGAQLRARTHSLAAQLSHTEQDFMRDLRFIVCVTERDIDLLILEELAVNEDFCRWLVRRLPGEPNYQNTLGAWHSVCDTTLGESDIVYAFVAATGKRIAVLIENKIGAPPQPEQAERYKQRGSKGIDRGDWDDCVTCPELEFPAFRGHGLSHLRNAPRRLPG